MLNSGVSNGNQQKLRANNIKHNLNNVKSNINLGIGSGKPLTPTTTYK